MISICSFAKLERMIFFGNVFLNKCIFKQENITIDDIYVVKWLKHERNFYDIFTTFYVVFVSFIRISFYSIFKVFMI